VQALGLAELGWAAGFIDADGSIGLMLRKAYLPPKVSPYVSANGVAKEPIELLHTYFGGSLYLVTRRGWSGLSQAQGQWIWRVQGYDALDVLEVLQPFLVLKCSRAWLAREGFLQQQEAWERHKVRGKDSPQLRALVEGYHAAMTHLNSRKEAA